MNKPILLVDKENTSYHLQRNFQVTLYTNRRVSLCTFEWSGKNELHWFQQTFVFLRLNWKWKSQRRRQCTDVEENAHGRFSAVSFVCLFAWTVFLFLSMITDEVCDLRHGRSSTRETDRFVCINLQRFSCSHWK